MTKTAIDWLIEELNLDHLPHTIKQAKEMEKQQIIDALTYGNKSELMASQKMFAEQYYNETYGSKGSDEHIEHNLDEIEKSEKPINLLSNQEGIFYSHNDVLEMMKKFHTYEMNIELNMLKLTPLNLTSSQTEISDEEIEEAAKNAWSDYVFDEGNLYYTTFKGGWEYAIKWYREQLKSRQ